MRQVPSRAHLLFGGAIACLGLWLISFTVIEGVRVHFLGMTALTLILGWRFAILAGSAAVLAHTLTIGQSVTSIPAAWLLTVAVPATISRWLVFQLRNTRAQNLFVYMLGAGFGGGALSSLAATVTAVGLLWLAGQQTLVHQALENWPAALLLLFPEGFINGMVISALTVFYPDLLKTFDDETLLVRLGGHRRQGDVAEDSGIQGLRRSPAFPSTGSTAGRPPRSVLSMWSS